MPKTEIECVAFGSRPLMFTDNQGAGHVGLVAVGSGRPQHGHDERLVAAVEWQLVGVGGNRWHPANRREMTCVSVSVANCRWCGDDA